MPFACVLHAESFGRSRFARHRGKFAKTFRWWSEQLGIETSVEQHVNSGVLVFDPVAHAEIFAAWQQAGLKSGYSTPPGCRLVDEAALSVVLQRPEFAAAVQHLPRTWNNQAQNKPENRGGPMRGYVYHFCGNKAKEKDLITRTEWRMAGNAECGMRNAEEAANPKSEIRNPKPSSASGLVTAEEKRRIEAASRLQPPASSLVTAAALDLGDCPRVTAEYGAFDLPRGDWIGQCIERDGGNELDMLAAWRELVGPGSVAIDVGACFGTHSVYLARLGCRVHAIEPVHTDWLRSNLALNGVAGEDSATSSVQQATCRVHALAAAAEPGSCSAVHTAGNAGSSRLTPHPSPLTPQGSITAAPLDDLVADPVALVKLDVEGMELPALQGMPRILRESRPHLFIECATAEALRGVCASLEPLGYRQGRRYNATPTYHFVPPPKQPAKQAVVTINIGDVLPAKARASLEAAAARWDADYVEITEPIHATGGLPHWQKAFLARWGRANGYSRIAYFDSDVLIRGDAPSIFAATPAGGVGVVRHRDCCGRRWKRRTMRPCLAWWSRHLALPAPPTKDHLNSGVIVFEPQAHGPLFERWLEAGRSVEWQRKYLVDEAALSMLLNAGPAEQLAWLPASWNTWRTKATHGLAPEFVSHFASAAAKPALAQQEWDPQMIKPRIAAIMLHWKRPANVRRIVDGWRANPNIGHSVVWSNHARGGEPFKPSPGVMLVTSSRDAGLNSRWLAAALATHDCVLVQDDDLELPATTIAALYEAWQAEPDVIHGIFGRRPKADGSYDYRNAPAGEVPIVLTRALLVHRKYMFRMLQHLPEFESLQRAGTPNGNGEDIIFSHLVRRYSGRLNRVHDLPVKELSSAGAISGRPGHNRHRTAVVQFCSEWLGRNEGSGIRAQAMAQT